MLQTTETLKNLDSTATLSIEIKAQKNSSANWILDFTPTSNSINNFSDDDFLTLEHSHLVAYYLHLITAGAGHIKVDQQYYSIKLDEKSCIHAIALLQLCGLNLEKDFTVDQAQSRIVIDILNSGFLKNELDEGEDEMEDSRIEALQKLAFSSLLTRLTNCVYPVQAISIGVNSYQNYEEFTVESENLEKINLIVKTLLVDCEIKTSHNKIVLKGNKILQQLHNIYFERVNNLHSFCQTKTTYDDAHQGALIFLTKLIFGAGGLTNTLIEALGQSRELNNATKLIAAQNFINKRDEYSIFKQLDFKSCALSAFNKITPSEKGSPLSRSKRIQTLETFIKLTPEF